MTEPTTSQTGTHGDEAAPGEAPVAELVEAQETGADPVAADEVPGEGDTGAEERAAEGDADGDADGDSDGDSDGDADGDSDGGAAADGDRDADGDEVDVDRLEREGDIAADYLEELLDIADLDGDLDMDVEGDRAAVSIVGGDVRALVGRNGEVLEALQELTRLAVYRETGERSRLMLDVGGFRADKRSRLEKVAAEAIAEVQRSGERKALDPMSPFERKVVHDAVAAAGLTSASEGVEPRRFVVVLPDE